MFSIYKNNIHLELNTKHADFQKNLIGHMLWNVSNFENHMKVISLQALCNTRSMSYKKRTYKKQISH